MAWEVPGGVSVAPVALRVIPAARLEPGVVVGEGEGKEPGTAAPPPCDPLFLRMDSLLGSPARGAGASAAATAPPPLLSRLARVGIASAEGPAAEVPAAAAAAFSSWRCICRFFFSSSCLASASPCFHVCVIRSTSGGWERGQVGEHGAMCSA